MTFLPRFGIVLAALLFSVPLPAHAQLFRPEVPEGTDEVFVVSTSADDPDLDAYRYDEIEISFPITRRFGDTDAEGRLLDPDALIEADLLPPYAYVQIAAGDVDNSINQYDYVYLNGETQPVGIMTGEGGKFRLYTFFFDIRNLRFPSGAKDAEGDLVPRENVVVIDVDAFYNTANPTRTGTNVDFVAVGLSEPVKRPLLLAHGWKSSPDTWAELWRPRLEAEGYVYGETVVAPDLTPFRSVARGASRIAPAADQLRQDNGVDRISIMAHSQGGIDSRRYLWTQAPGTVHTLVTMASPNQGVGRALPLLRPRSDHFEWDPTLWPVQRWNQEVNDRKWGLVGKDLSRQSMEVFNEIDPVASNTTLHAYAASVPFSALPVTSSYRAIRLYEDKSLPSDGFVAVESVLGVPEAYEGENCYQLDNSISVALHGNQTRSLSIFDFIYPRFLEGEEGVLPPGALRQGPELLASAGPDEAGAPVIPLAVRPRSAYASPQSARSAMRLADTAECEDRPAVPDYGPGSARLAVSGLAETDGALGHVQPGQTATESVLVDAVSTATFTLAEQVAGLAFELVSPSGTVIDSMTTASGVTYADLSADMPIKTFAVDSPEVGVWTARVRLDAAATDSVGYAVNATLEESAVSFSVGTDDDRYTVGETVEVFATLAGGTGTVEATLVDPQRTTMTSVPLADDGLSPDVSAGDGVYSGSFSTAGGDAGWYSFAARALASDGSFSRVAHTLIPVARGSLTPPTVTSDAGVDRNGNGLYDSLRVTVTIPVTETGTYLVRGTLTGAGNAIDNASAFADLPAGSHTLTLDFDGRAVRRSGVAGPYAIENLTVVRLDVEADDEPYPFATTVGATGSYATAEFERSAVELVGTPTSEVFDDDGDSYFDRLVVTVPFDLLYPDTYDFHLQLTEEDGALIAASGYPATTVSAGTYSLPFTFSGDDIRASGVDGEYVARNLLIQGVNYGASLILARVADAGTYVHTQFGSPPASASSALPVLAAPVVEVVSGTATVMWQDAAPTETDVRYAVQVVHADSSASGWSEVAASDVRSDGTYSAQVRNIDYGRYRVRVVRSGSSGLTTASPEADLEVGVEGTHALGLVRPNPFRGGASVPLAVPEPQRVIVEVYDLLGRRVATAYDGEVPADQTVDVPLDGRGLSSGTYVVRVRGATFAEVRRVTVVR